MVDTGAVDTIESEIAALTDEAMEALSRMSLAGDADRALAELAHFVAFRAH